MPNACGIRTGAGCTLVTVDLYLRENYDLYLLAHRGMSSSVLSPSEGYLLADQYSISLTPASGKPLIYFCTFHCFFHAFHKKSTKSTNHHVLNSFLLLSKRVIEVDCFLKAFEFKKVHVYPQKYSHKKKSSRSNSFILLILLRLVLLLSVACLLLLLLLLLI